MPLGGGGGSVLPGAPAAEGGGGSDAEPRRRPHPIPCAVVRAGAQGPCCTGPVPDGGRGQLYPGG